MTLQHPNANNAENEVTERRGLFTSLGDALLTKMRRNSSFFLAVVLLVVVVLLLILAPILMPNPDTQDILARLSPPVWLLGGHMTHLLGTDELGRDVLTRVLWGGRIALLVGSIASLMSVAVGTLLGLISGYFGGWIDQLFGRFADLLMAFPFLLFAIGLISVLGPGFWNTVLALAFKGWVEFYRLARVAVKEEMAKEYVSAAKSVGVTVPRILVRHIFVNIMAPIIALGTLRVGSLTVLESSLSFLGLGIQPPTPDWGRMIYTGSGYLFDAPWISIAPGIALAGTVFLINLVGEGIQARLVGQRRH